MVQDGCPNKSGHSSFEAVSIGAHRSSMIFFVIAPSPKFNCAHHNPKTVHRISMSSYPVDRFEYSPEIVAPAEPVQSYMEAAERSDLQ